jgi:argininosuccinate synthase
MPPARLIEALNEIGGRHGVGRADIVENRLVGIKSRGVYETPGGTLLVTALKALESITLDRDSAHEKERLALRYAELVYFGQWFSPLKEALDAFTDRIAEPVTGEVTLKLFKATAAAVSRRSPRSLYSTELASFSMNGYGAKDAAGFIRLFGLQTRGRKRLPPFKMKAVRSRKTSSGRA